jgi:hypothetical protein
VEAPSEPRQRPGLRLSSAAFESATARKSALPLPTSQSWFFAGPKARHHTSLGQRPRSQSNQASRAEGPSHPNRDLGLGFGPGFQPCPALRRSSLGRWPRLVWPAPLALRRSPKLRGARASSWKEWSGRPLPESEGGPTLAKTCSFSRLRGRPDSAAILNRERITGMPVPSPSGVVAHVRGLDPPRDDGLDGREAHRDRLIPSHEVAAWPDRGPPDAQRMKQAGTSRKFPPLPPSQRAAARESRGPGARPMAEFGSISSSEEESAKHAKNTKGVRVGEFAAPSEHSVHRARLRALLSRPVACLADPASEFGASRSPIQARVSSPKLCNNFLPIRMNPSTRKPL